jgi:copper(I)-binding protein
MLIDLVQPLTPGMKVVLSLRFAEAGTVEIIAPTTPAAITIS